MRPSTDYPQNQRVAFRRLDAEMGVDDASEFLGRLDAGEKGLRRPWRNRDDHSVLSSESG